MTHLFRTLLTVTALAAALLLAACEKPFATDDDDNDTPQKGNITFRIAHYETSPMTAAAVATPPSGSAPAAAPRRMPVAQLATRINLGVYDAAGNRLKALNQTADDENFGTLSLSLDAGTYTVVIIAHSCSGNATMTSPTEIKFPNNKVTDTFCYCTELNVGQEVQTIDVMMRRAVAQFCLSTTDDVPAQAALMTFKYTGGSSTLDATTGYGCVNSRQTETRTIDAALHGQPAEFSIYTFPHAETGQLKITATATDASQATLRERVFDEVPIARNQITTYEGSFFYDDEQLAPRFELLCDDEWTQKRIFF